MNLIFRLIYTIIRAFFRPKLAFLDASVLRMRVFPNDLDLNLHMTNSRYLSVMDLGRLDHLIRTGVFRHFFRNRWRPVLGAIHLRYRRALSPFQPYYLVSKILAIDAKWVYFEHKMMTAEGELASYALAKGAFLGKKGTVPMKEVLQELGTGKLKLPIVKSIEHWIHMEQSIARDKNVKEFDLPPEHQRKSKKTSKNTD